MKKVLPLLLFVFIFFFVSCSKNHNTDNEPLLVLRYGDNQGEYYPTTRAARYFADRVKEKSGGRIEIEVYGDGKLGSENEVFRMLEYGGVDFMRLSIGTLSAFYPEFGILQLPYLFSSSEHMWRVLDGGIGEEFMSYLNQKSIGLAWFDAGARSIYTREQISSLSDLEDKLIRTQENDEMEYIFSLLGARTIQIPYGSVYSELKKKTIDGAENNFPSYMYTGHSDVAKYVFLDEHMRLPELMVMGKKAEESIAALGDDLLDIIRQCAKEAGVFERELWTEEESKAKRDAISSSCIIVYPTEEELNLWKEAVTPIYDALEESEREMVERVRAY